MSENMPIDVQCVELANRWERQAAFAREQFRSLEAAAFDSALNSTHLEIAKEYDLTVSILRAAPETAAERDRLRAELTQELQGSAEKNVALADARSELTRLRESNAELLAALECLLSQSITNEADTRSYRTAERVNMTSAYHLKARNAIARAKGVV